jgi:predicted Fe-S protein YdhL (DUF1289 family)
MARHPQLPIPSAEFWKTHKRPEEILSEGTNENKFICNVPRCPNEEKQDWSNLGRHLLTHGKPAIVRSNKPTWTCKGCQKTMATGSRWRHLAPTEIKDVKNKCPHPDPQDLAKMQPKRRRLLDLIQSHEGAEREHAHTDADSRESNNQVGP